MSTTPLPLGQTPPVAAVVGDVTCTVNVLAACVVPAGTVAGPQDSVPATIAHEPQPAPWFAICHESPDADTVGAALAIALVCARHLGRYEWEETLDTRQLMACNAWDCLPGAAA